MNVTCPQCNTVYRLPDEKIRAGAKLRCSVCHHIFMMPMKESTPEKKRTPDDSVSERLELSGDDPSLKNPMEDNSLSLSLGKSAEESQEKLNISAEAPVLGMEEKSLLSDQPAEKSLQLGSEGKSSSLDGLHMPQKKTSIAPKAVSLLLCLGLAAGCGWAWENTPYFDGIKEMLAPYIGEKIKGGTPSDPLSLVSELELRDVRQYQVKNPKAGTLIVMEGKVRNNFPAPRALIRLEAELYDASGKMLVSQQQIAGKSMSSFQLELLDQEELDKVLHNKVDIMETNTNVLPGNEVPFTVIFVNPPAEASDYKVRIASAALPQGPGNLKE
ncbi:MAG: DUF3426 domain-containing protein [Mailhella sp.]